MWNFFKKESPILDAVQRHQVLKDDILQCAVSHGKRVQISDLQQQNWPHMTFEFAGVVYGYLERALFAPPYLVVGHIATASHREGSEAGPKRGYGPSIAEGLKKLCLSLGVEKIIFSEEMQGHGHPAFFAKLGAVKLKLNPKMQKSEDYMWALTKDDEFSRNPVVNGMTTNQKDAVLALDKLVMSVFRNAGRHDWRSRAKVDLQAQKDVLFRLASQETVQDVARIDLAIAALKKFP